MVALITNPSCRRFDSLMPNLWDMKMETNFGAEIGEFSGGLGRLIKVRFSGRSV